jgi:tRNA nucleotidyltransferase/poly(A) polymerase
MERPSGSAPGSPERPSPREAAVRIARELIEAGHTAYFAGGCVRDQLMGVEPTDYDIATSAVPEQVQRLFRSVQTVGESFGVMLVRMLGHTVQVAAFRTDGVYSDGRHPDSVAYSDAQHDAMRRDFTINGLFQHPLTGEIVDYVGGRRDLEARVIRAIGDPFARFGEDHLRMLRAVRFASRFEFDLDGETAEAIRRTANNLAGVSRERIGQEVQKMLTHFNRGVAAWHVQYLGLDTAVLAEEHINLAPTRLGRLPEDAPYSTALAAWLLDRHESRKVDQFERIARWTEALMLSNADSAGLRAAVEIYLALGSAWPRLGVARQKRLASHPSFSQGLMIVQTVDRQSFIDIRRRVIELATTELSPTPLLDGTDLIRAGLPPGPVFKQVLEAVYDAQLEGSVSVKEQALALARALAADENRRR